VSLHTNAYSTESPSGFEVFYSDIGHDVSGSKKLADLFYSTMKEEAIFDKASPAKIAPFYLLKNSEAPSVTVELGFISNPGDAAIMTNERQQELIATTLLRAIGSFKKK
jgi:N-acetylmuramoyl-L-alanine amidase